jgi:hypothetical protein
LRLIISTVAAGRYQNIGVEDAEVFTFDRLSFFPANDPLDGEHRGAPASRRPMRRGPSTARLIERLRRWVRCMSKDMLTCNARLRTTLSGQLSCASKNKETPSLRRRNPWASGAIDGGLTPTRRPTISKNILKCSAMLLALSMPVAAYAAGTGASAAGTALAARTPRAARARPMGRLAPPAREPAQMEPTAQATRTLRAARAASTVRRMLLRRAQAQIHRAITARAAMPRRAWTRPAPRSRVAKKTERRRPALLCRAGCFKRSTHQQYVPLKRAARPPLAPAALTAARMLMPGAASSNTRARAAGCSLCPKETVPPGRARRTPPA